MNKIKKMGKNAKITYTVSRSKIVRCYQFWIWRFNITVKCRAPYYYPTRLGLYQFLLNIFENDSSKNKAVNLMRSTERDNADIWSSNLQLTKHDCLLFANKCSSRSHHHHFISSFIYCIHLANRPIGCNEKRRNSSGRNSKICIRHFGVSSLSVHSAKFKVHRAAYRTSVMQK